MATSEAVPMQPLLCPPPLAAIAAEEVWLSLSPMQQGHLRRVLVTVCQELVAAVSYQTRREADE